MSIIYTLIANKIDNVICEYTDKGGNFQQITRVILNKEVEPNTMKALEKDNFKFHYINENKITFLALSEGMNDSLMISYLKEVKKNLYKTYEYDLVLNSQAYQLSSFSKNIQELIEYYKDTPRKSIGGEVIQDLVEAKNLITKNITQLLERDQKLDIIVTNAQSLRVDAEKVSGFVSYYLLKIL